MDKTSQIHTRPGKFTYASVCSGIECATVALRGLDWEPVFFSEIEPFPCELLAYRYPSVPNLGDMTHITYDAKKDEVTNGPVTISLHGHRLDALLGGTPCQDVSCAGRRAGMEEGSGTRSSLAWHYVRLVRELRPHWLVWENVPGVLSSNGGGDFSRFVQALTSLGYCIGWRVLDAQWTRVDTAPLGVPQRRRRVWLVGCDRDQRSALEEVLFEPEGVLGDTPPRRETREEAAERLGGCSPLHRGAGRGPFGSYANGGEPTGCLCAHDGRGFNGQDAYDGKIVVDGYPALYVDPMTSSEGDVCPCVDTRTGRQPNHQAEKGGGYILQKAVYPIDTRNATRTSEPSELNRQGLGLGEDGEPSATLTRLFTPAVAIAGMTTIRERAGKPGGGKGPLLMQDCSQVLLAHNDQALALYDKDLIAFEPEASGTRDFAIGETATVISGRRPGVCIFPVVRRLTPLECERLQCLPDFYTLIPTKKWRKVSQEEMAFILANVPAYAMMFREKGDGWETCLAADAPRYKAIGNGWATNCARYILLRLAWMHYFYVSRGKRFAAA